MTVSSIHNPCFDYSANVWSKTKRGIDVTGKVVNVAQRILATLQLLVVPVALLIGCMIELSKLMGCNRKIVKHAHKVQNTAIENKVVMIKESPQRITNIKTETSEEKKTIVVPASSVPAKIDSVQIQKPAPNAPVKCSSTITKLSARTLSFVDQIKQLSVQADELTKCPSRDLPKFIENVNQSILQLLNDSQCKPFKNDLEDLQRRLKNITDEIRQNPNTQIALDCFGILVRVHFIFRDTLPPIKSKPHREDVFTYMRNGNYELMEKFILEHRYDVNTRTLIEETTRRAIEYYNNDPKKAVQMIKTVIRAGAELNFVNLPNMIFIPPLYSACSALVKNKIPLIQLFLTNGSNLNIAKGPHIERVGAFPFAVVKMYNITRITEEEIQFLIDQGLNINMKRDNSETPLSFALSKNKDSLAKRLIYNGANPIIANLSQRDKEKIEKWVNLRKRKVEEYAKNALITKMLLKSPSMKKIPVDLLAMISKYNLSTSDNSAICKLCYEAEANQKP